MVFINAPGGVEIDKVNETIFHISFRFVNVNLHSQFGDFIRLNDSLAC